MGIFLHQQKYTEDFVLVVITKKFIGCLGKNSMHKLGALYVILKALHLNYSKPDIFLVSAEVCLGS
jgi:hypothetical protein